MIQPSIRIAAKFVLHSHLLGLCLLCAKFFVLGEAVPSAIVKNSIDEQFLVTITKQESYEVLIRSMITDPGMVFNMAQGFIGIKR